MHNVLKRISKQKSRNRKFPLYKLFMGLSHFLTTMVFGLSLFFVQMVKKAKLKILANFFCQNRLKMFQNVFQNEIEKVANLKKIVRKRIDRNRFRMLQNVFQYENRKIFYYIFFGT